MKAAVVYGENDIRIAEVPRPEPGPGEVLVRVRGSGVCATDVKILGGSGLPKELPTILGHEVAGEIEAVGQGVTGLEPRRRVAVYPIAVCGQCMFCRQDRHSLCPTQYGLAHGLDGGQIQEDIRAARAMSAAFHRGPAAAAAAAASGDFKPQSRTDTYELLCVMPRGADMEVRFRADQFTHLGNTDVAGIFDDLL